MSEHAFTNHKSTFIPLEMVLLLQDTKFNLQAMRECARPPLSSRWPLRTCGWLGPGGSSESAQWCVLGVRKGWLRTDRVSHV